MSFGYKAKFNTPDTVNETLTEVDPSEMTPVHVATDGDETTYEVSGDDHESGDSQ